jgi:dihydrofolate synthase/folylpolyglutamate synthase
LRSLKTYKRTLEEWLAWMETLHPREIELGLERVVTVRDRLGLAQPVFAIVTVGGTNGKGSTVALLEHVLNAAGYRVGAYTSPHLVRHNERIRLGTAEITDADLVAAFERVEQARADTPLTYFEFGTLAALDFFQQRGVDIAVLEVGLGGRLDAVNAWDPEVAVVTSIGIDHTAWLGPDRESIGREKAGIFRTGRCAVCGDPQPPLSLIEHAARIGARLVRVHRDFDFERRPEGWTWRSLDGLQAGLPYPAMRGDCQLYNAAAVFMALECLADRFPVTAADLRAGLTQTVLPGRFQTLPGRPLRVFDVAHNAQAAEALAHTLKAQVVPGRTLAVCAMLRDKPIAEVAAALAPLVGHWHVAGLDVARGASGEEMRAALAEAGIGEAVSVHADVEQAYRAALAAAGENDRIVVFGSFHTVGAILRAHSNSVGTMAERKDTNDEFNPRHRIIGAVILVALAVIFLPMLLSDRPPATQATGTTETPLPETRAVVQPAARPGEAPGPTAATPADDRLSGPRTVTVPVEPGGAMRGVAAPEPVTGETAKSVPAKTAAAPSTATAPAKEKGAGTKAPTAVAAARPATAEKGWVVQVGVFSQPENARRLQERIRQKGYHVRLDPPVPAAGKPVRVEVGPYKQSADAKAAAARIQDEFGIKGLVRSH